MMDQASLPYINGIIIKASGLDAVGMRSAPHAG